MKLSFDGIRVTLPEFMLAIDGEFDSEALGVFGPSGAGKTTLLELIAGVRPAESGTIWLNGRNLTSLPARARRIGYVPQDETLFPHMSVRANVTYGERRNFEPGAQQAAVLAEMLEITPLLDRGVARLSGGERRRVAIARALATAPDCLLLDEPLAGLDRLLKDRTIGLLREVRSELRLPMIFVSHERQEVVALCDQVMVLDRGRIGAQGAPELVL